MYIGSLTNENSKLNITYAYKKRGMEKTYLPDYIKEEPDKKIFHISDKLFEDFIGFDGTVLLNRAVDIEINFGKSCFADTLSFVQAENSAIRKIEVLSEGKPVGVYNPETGKNITSSDISVGLGVYTEKLTLRLTGAYKNIIIGKLNIIGALDMDDALFPLPKSVVYKEGYLRDTSKVTYNIVPSDTEKYTISVALDGAKVTASSKLMANYAKSKLNALTSDKGIRLCEISDSPFMGIRGVHIGLPDRKNIPFLKSLVENLLVPMGYNTVFIQISAAMEYKKYPKINRAWTEAVINYESGKWPKPAHWEFISHDILTQDEVKDICAFIRSFGIEIIPEVQLLGHTQYITMAYPELGELADAGESDVNLFNEDKNIDNFYIHCMCPNHIDYYKTAYEIIDEVIEVVNPEKYIHIGHDEVYTIGRCKECRKTPAYEVYAYEVNNLNDYIKSKGLVTMLWSDMIQEAKYETNKAIDLISKDIICLSFTWYFHMDEDVEEVLYNHGFKFLIGNFYSSHYPRFNQRNKIPGIMGAEVSTWVWCNELCFAYDGKLFDMMYSANMMIDDRYDEALRRTYTEIIKRIYSNIAQKMGVGYIPDNAKVMDIPKSVADVPFDIRSDYDGALSVGCGEGIEIKADINAEKIAFLHSTDLCGERIVWKAPQKHGIYTLCYDDDTKTDIDILYGANIYEYKKCYGLPVESDLFRHEGYVATCFARPYTGKTLSGEDYCLYEYTAVNPYPDKKIKQIILSHTGETDSKIILYGIRYV